MNYIWGAMMLISIVCAVLTGRVDETVNAVFDGAKGAADTLLALAGVMCFWTGLMKIAERSGISAFISKALSPLLRLLFPSSGDKAREHIAMNLTANILGMGNAATPAGIMAAQELDRENPSPGKPSINICMLIVLNTTAFQLVPATLIALRSAAGAHDAASVILPIWFASAVSVCVGVISVKIMGRLIKCGT